MHHAPAEWDCLQDMRQDLPLGFMDRLQRRSMNSEEINEKVAALLHLCLDIHSGEFDPSWISHKISELKLDDDRLYSRSRLNELLAPGRLKSIVEKHPEFTWRPKNPNQPRQGMIITWSEQHVPNGGKSSAGHASGSASAWDGGREWSEPSNAQDDHRTGWSSSAGRHCWSGGNQQSRSSNWSEQHAPNEVGLSAGHASGSARAWGAARECSEQPADLMSQERSPRCRRAPSAARFFKGNS